MAVQSASLTWSLLAVAALIVGVASVHSSCGHHHRYRKPRADTYEWQGYFVALTILLGSGCGLAWCILIVTYNMGQRGGQELPKIPSADEQVPSAMGHQDELNETLTPGINRDRAVTFGITPWQKSQDEEGQPWLQRQASNKGVRMQSQSDTSIRNRKPSQLNANKGVSSSPQMNTDEGIRTLFQVNEANRTPSQMNTNEVKRVPTQMNTNEAIIWTPSQTNTNEAVWTPSQNEVTRTPTQTSINKVKKAPTQLDINQTIGIPSQTNTNEGRVASPPQQEGLSLEVPSQPKEQSGGALWTFMEQELEKLLSALRLHRTTTPAPPHSPEETTTALASAEEAPKPAVEEALILDQTEEKDTLMHLIICEVPQERGATRGRGRKRKASRGRK